MIVRNIRELKQAIRDLPDDMPLFERLNTREIVAHSITQYGHAFCYTASYNDGKTYNCCSKDRPVVKTLRISSI